MAALESRGESVTVDLRRAAAGTGVLAAAYLAGSIPFAQIGAQLRRGVDLREVGTGTVSGTGLYRVAGFGALAVYGVLDVAKGAVGPALAARVAGRPSTLATAAASLAVAGHNWSPFLRGQGGRGIAPAMGALLVTAPEGAALLLTGLAVGKLAGATATGCAVADVLLVPVLELVGGPDHGTVGAAVLAPLLAARLAGNGPPIRRSATVYLRRLLLDRDTWQPA